MSARFEVVRGDAQQPWHGRLIVNGRTTWVTETHSRQVGVERAICSLLAAAGGGTWYLAWNVEGVEKVATNDVGQLHDVLVKYVDERTGAGQ